MNELEFVVALAVAGFTVPVAAMMARSALSVWLSAMERRAGTMDPKQSVFAR